MDSLDNDLYKGVDYRLKSIVSNTFTIYQVTTPFYDSYSKAVDKLESLIEDIEDTTICFIFKYAGKSQTIISDIKKVNNKIVAKSVCFIDDYLLFSLKYELKNVNDFKSYGWISNLGKVNNIPNFKNDLSDLVYDSILLSLFVKYAKVKVKHLKPKSRTKEFNCKYVNDTNSDIQILDSTWFTTLVKSDEFKVRGHFRLQPKKKDGEWTKELIWISEFKKDGYVRKCKKPVNSIHQGVGYTQIT